MGLKGTIQPDHIPLNKYQLIVLGMPPLDFTTIAGLEEELDTVELPDRTVVTGGRTKPVEFTAKLPMHHTVQQAAVELWFQESQDPVSPTYKKPGTLILTSLTGGTVRSFSFPDIFPAKRTIPDFEMNNEGEMAEEEWMFKASDILPI